MRDAQVVDLNALSALTLFDPTQLAAAELLLAAHDMQNVHDSLVPGVSIDDAARWLHDLPIPLTAQFLRK